MSDPAKKLAPYDLIATRWSSARRARPFREKVYVDRFLDLARAGGEILDLGCGMGHPIAGYLLARGHPVAGVDASIEMIRLARENCPAATFIHGDIESLDCAGKYAGIVAWDSIFHIPRARHARVFALLQGWLEPEAPLLLSLGGSADEFTDTMFDVEFFYSGHAPAQSLALLEEAGFEIILAEVDDPGSRGHIAVLCRRRA